MSAAPRPGIDRPLTIVIAAMGGEGGGLLADWIVSAAKEAGVLAQTTSIPGVAQRSGATTYYVELMAPAKDQPREPIFALYPAPGYIDIAVASELMEAGRLIQNGFVSADRTTLVASAHRVFTIGEKGAMADGVFEATRIVDAARAVAARVISDDFAALAKAEGSAINAILLGAVAGAQQLVSAESFERAIEARGVAVAANLKGFRAGRAYAADGAGPKPATPELSTSEPDLSADGLTARAREALPTAVMDIVAAGIDRLVDYQDKDYAALYVDRVIAVHAVDRQADFALTRETGRYLALWMAYEDVIRVADLKSRAARFARVRDEAAAKPGEPVMITEFLKPGVDEAATVLPAGIGRRLRDWAARKGITDKLHMPLHLRSDTIFGFMLLRVLARQKRRRRKGLRYREEQAMIDRWLGAVISAATLDQGLGREVAECGRLIKGYSDTRARANRNFNAIFARLVEPGLTGGDPSDMARRIAAATKAALADDEGTELARVLDATDAPAPVLSAAAE